MILIVFVTVLLVFYGWLTYDLFCLHRRHNTHWEEWQKEADRMAGLSSLLEDE